MKEPISSPTAKPLSPEQQTEIRKQLKTLLADGEHPLAVPSSVATRVARVEAGGEAFYVKVFLARNWLDSIKQQFRGSRAARATKAARILRQAGFRTPDIVLSGDHGARSWLVSRAVPGVSLGIYAESFLRGALSRERMAWKRLIIARLGDLVGSLHRQGIVHGDLRLNNILIDAHEKTPVFYLIDNERNRHFTGLPPEKLRVKNLVQVGLLYPAFGSRTDQLRFFRAYWRQLPTADTSERRRITDTAQDKYRGRLADLARKPRQNPPSAPRGVSNVPR